MLFARVGEILMRMTGEVRQTTDKSSVTDDAAPGDSDTGAAALTIVAALHQRAVDVTRIAHDSGRPGQPLGPDDLVLAARRNQFRAKLVRSVA